MDINNLRFSLNASSTSSFEASFDRFYIPSHNFYFFMLLYLVCHIMQMGDDIILYYFILTYEGVN